MTALEPEQIFLFGSYAYGEPTEDSDVDLLPTFRTLNSDREKLRGEKIQVSIKTNILRKKGI